MSWSNALAVTSLNPGEPAYWWYSWGSDQGPQMAEADIKTPNAGAVHRADNQKKSKDNNGNVTYYVTITNEGPGVCWHNLQGGSLA